MKRVLLVYISLSICNSIFTQVTPSGGNNLQYNESAGPHDNAAPYSYTYTAGTGTNRLLLLIITHESQSANQINDFASVTYGGQTLTQVANVNVGGSGGNFSNRTAIFSLRETGIAAASNTTVTINYTNGNNIKGVGVSTIMFQNVNQVRPTEDPLTNSSASATSLSTGPFSVVSNNYVVAGINGGQSGNSFTASAGYTLNHNNTVVTSSHRHGYSSKAITIAGNETPGFTFASDRVAMVSVEVNNLLIVLPVRLTNFSASLSSNNTASIKWKVNNEESILQYELERSDGNNVDFQRVGSAILSNTTNDEYIINDSRTINGIALYRLKITEQSGQITYSNTLLLKTENTKNSTVTSPFTDNINLLTYSTGNNMAVISLYNTNGQLVQQQKFQLSNGANSLLIQPARPLNAGAYYIVIDKENSRETLSLLKQ